MMIGISTSYFSARGYSIYDSVKKACEMGFRLIELGANHDYEENVWQTVEKIAKDFPEVTFTQHCYFPPIFKTPTYTNTAEGLTKINLRVMEQMLAAAKILKTPVISFHPGQNNKVSFEGTFESFKGFKKFKTTEKISQEKAIQGVFAFFKKILKLAKKQNLKVAVENSFIANSEGKTTLQNYQDFAMILNKLPGLNFLFDYGHATLLTNQPNQFFEFKDKIVEMHLHDVTYGNLDHRLLGTGKVSLSSLFFEIKKLKIKPYLILEHSGEPSVEEIIKEKKLVERYLV